MHDKCFLVLNSSQNIEKLDSERNLDLKKKNRAKKERLCWTFIFR